MAMSGQGFPQEGERDVTTDEADVIEQKAQSIVRSFMAAKSQEEVRAGIVDAQQEIQKVSKKHGRYTGLALLCMSWAMQAVEVDIPALPKLGGAVREEVMDLARVFQFAAFNSEEEGVWPVPLAMFHSADDQTSHEAAFLLMAAACWGIYQSIRKERERG